MRGLLGKRGEAVSGWWHIIEPQVPRHSLGSCAVVGLSSRILGSCFGQAIDSHDTVIRFGGAPTGRWSKDVGTRKSIQLVRLPRQSTCRDIDHDVWFKGGQVKEADASAADTRPPERFYLVLSNSNSQCSGTTARKTFKDVPVKYMDLDGAVHNATDRMYRRFAANGGVLPQGRKALKATTGFKFVTGLIISQACRRVDLYGFGQGEGGHYFLPKSQGPGMKGVHSLGLEHWLFQRAMSASVVCRYDKEGLRVGATC